MQYFDFERMAREAHVPPEKLDDLSHMMRQDFPRDEMMYELHLLRACMAIREGVLTLEEALKSEPAPKS
ncbi:MAG TPA: hypothetical protein VKU44_04340 [Terriglobia bacterium]|nr:hypothetical protein [Terriglobia bacterium]